MHTCICATETTETMSWCFNKETIITIFETLYYRGKILMFHFYASVLRLFALALSSNTLLCPSFNSFLYIYTSDINYP